MNIWKNISSKVRDKSKVRVKCRHHGKTDISGRGWVCNGIEVSGGSGRQEAVGGLRIVSRHG